jgi:hypothetical protein
MICITEKLFFLYVGFCQYVARRQKIPLGGCPQTAVRATLGATRNVTEWEDCSDGYYVFILKYKF